MRAGLKPLVPFYLYHLKTYLLLVLVGGLISFLDVALLTRAKNFLDQAMWQGKTILFLKQGGILLCIFIFVEGFRLFQAFQEELVAKRFCQRLQDALVGSMIAAPLTTFLSQSRGDLLQHIMKNADRLSYFSSYFFSSFLKDPLRAIFFGFLLFRTSPRFGLIAVCIGVAVLFFTKIFKKKIKPLFQKLQKNEGNLFNRLETILHHFSFLKSHNSGEIMYSHWCQLNQKVLALNTQTTKLLNKHAFFQHFFMLVALGILFSAAFFDFKLFENTPGTIALVAGATFFCFSGLRSMANSWAGLTDEWERAKKLSTILQWQPEQNIKQTLQILSSPLREVQLKSLSFEYESKKKVLSDLNWTLIEGAQIALTGGNGSGKTTLAYLLLRLLDPKNGSLLYNGIDSTALDVKALRRRIGLVFQEPFLIDGSLQENLLYNVQEKSFELQKEALDLVGLGNLALDVETLMQYQVGAKGWNLSYGERQKLALARAVLTDPDLLILDEATSAIDSDSEKRILSQLIEKRARKMTIFITHRLKSLPFSLKCFHLQNGKVIETLNESN